MAMDSSGDAATGGVFCLVLEEGPPDMLGLVLAQCGARSLLRSVCPVSRLFAACAEPVLRSQCEAYGWRLPKSSRLASNSDFPWRALYAARACRECAGMQGDFAIRRWKDSHPEFYRAHAGSNLVERCSLPTPDSAAASFAGSVRPLLQGPSGGAHATRAQADPRRDGPLWQAAVYEEGRLFLRRRLRLLGRCARHCQRCARGAPAAVG